MKTYRLTEFTSLLRLGLWSGGRIPGFGYLSVARQQAGGNAPAGIGGVWLGGGVTLESSRPDPEGSAILTFSIYDPYRGEYLFYGVSATLESEEVEESLETLLEQEGQLYRKRKQNLYISFQQKRRYEAIHSSYRGGTVPTSRRRR